MTEYEAQHTAMGNLDDLEVKYAELKEKAKKLGLWNLFLSKAHYPQFGVPLTNLEVRTV